MPIYSGSCHCGAIRFEIDTEITDLYTCDCSLCSKKNALMTSVHESRFKLVAGEDKLTLYQEREDRAPLFLQRLRDLSVSPQALDAGSLWDQCARAG